VTGANVPDGLRSPDGWLKASSDDGRFASLFGRDSLIAALQLLPLDPSIADATLGALGEVLGERDDPEREEEPGKVPHEVRRHDLGEYVAHGWPVRSGELRYYGSVDASCWWLIVFGALARHGAGVRHHRAAAGRVAAWLAGRPTPLTYARRASSGGLAHHWWRDVAADLVDASPPTGHGMYGDDGSPMHGPVAPSAVCALAWRALSEAAVFVDRSFAAAAGAARVAFGSLPRFALHDGGRVRADAPTSDLGIVRWTGIAGDGASVPDELVTPYGLRTLAPSHPAFRVDGYHTGAVWPWDTWIGAPALWPGVVDAVRRLGGYPELYAVELDGTLRPSPEACAVQAWTFGAVAAIEAGWDGRSWAAG
jgi:glycogen debranching enzyme